MKIMHEQVDFPGRSAIKVKSRDMPHFTFPWHFHSEFEILYVIDGEGTSFVADNIEEFKGKDLALIGSNLPHFWRSDEKYLNSNGKLKVKYIVVQFPDDFFSEQILNYPEFNVIRELLERSARGIRFSAEVIKKIEKKIIRITKTKGLKRILLLMEILEKLAAAKEYKLLAGELYQIKAHNFSSDRLTKVMHYLNTNYQSKIELNRVADVANLHPAAFCRFFKEKSGKSLFEFVNDMRISYACRLILKGQLSVSQICFESGFNNLSNFNRTFKKHTGFTPSGYFNEYSKK